MYITYDDTFEGLLSALYFYYTQPDITFVRRSAALPLIAYSPHITHVQNAQKIASRIRRRFGEVAYENIYFAFLSDESDLEQTIIDYLSCLINKNDPYLQGISKIFEWRRRILNTVYHYYGFLRFSEKNHLLYAAYAPDYDISLLLANYFTHRLSSAPYILHDCRRKTMLLHNNHRYLLTEAKEEFLAENLEKEEQYIQALFRSYFDAAAIKERTNPRLQRNNFPLKMRAYAFEFDKADK